MQKDFNDFGEDFSLFILDEINSYADRIKEYEWMKKYQSHIRGKGYNYNDKAVNTIYAKCNIPLKNGIPKYEP